MRASVILASGSPQRADIMRELGLSFETHSIDVNEVVLETPELTTRENAKLKALAALQFSSKGRVVVAADTMLCVDGRVLGKPGTPQRAREYLRNLSGRTVMAVSSVAAMRNGCETGWLVTESAKADVKVLSGDEIEGYVLTREPLGRAGAIGISRYGEIFIDTIHGSYSCIAGLPKRALLAALARVFDDGVETLPFFRIVRATDSFGLKVEPFKSL